MGKRKKRQEEKPSSLIMMMTVSLFIILLAFFILLNSIAVVDDQRQRKALGSLMENFGVLSGGFSVLREDNQNISTEKITQITSLLDFSDLIKGDADPLNNLIVTEDRNRSVVTLPAAVLFEAASARIKPSAHAVLDRLAGVIGRSGYSTDIAGFMDKGPGAADAAYSSREQSALRALAVLRYFVEEGGVASDLLTAYGWGEYKPIADNKLRESRRLNQRIEVTMLRKKRLEKPEGFFSFRNFFFNVFDK